MRLSWAGRRPRNWCYTFSLEIFSYVLQLLFYFVVRRLFICPVQLDLVFKKTKIEGNCFTSHFQLHLEHRRIYLQFPPKKRNWFFKIWNVCAYRNNKPQWVRDKFPTLGAWWNDRYQRHIHPGRAGCNALKPIEGHEWGTVHDGTLSCINHVIFCYMLFSMWDI